MPKRKLIGYYCKNEFQEIAASRLGARLVAEEFGYDIAFIREWEFLNIESLDGLIYGGRVSLEEEVDEYARLRDVKATGLPVVCANIEIEGFYSVEADSDDGIFRSVEHLHSLGYRKFVFVGGISTGKTVADRKVAFYNSLELLGISRSDVGVINGISPYFPNQSELTNLFPRFEEPVGFVCWNDSTATSVLGAIVQAGYRVPEDYAVTGFDDNSLFEYNRQLKFTGVCPLTTYSLPSFRIGREAMLLLNAVIEGGHLPRQESFRVSGRLHVRQSTVGWSKPNIVSDADRSPVDELIFQIYERMSHIPLGALDRWRDDLEIMYSELSIDLKMFRQSVFDAVDDGFDIFVAYPILLHVEKEVFSREKELFNGAQLVEYIRGYVDSRQSIQQTHQYTVSRNFFDNAAGLKFVGKDDDQGRIVSILRDVWDKLGNSHGTLLLFERPIAEDAIIGGKGFLWDLLDEGGAQGEVVDVDPSLNVLTEIYSKGGRGHSSDVHLLKSNSLVHGVLILGVKTEYWVFNPSLAELCATMLYHFNLFQELREKAEELRVQKARADSANKAKTDFLTVMSHELRTPLNCVIGMSEAMLVDNEVRPDDKLNLNLIKQSGLELLDTINDILDYSEFESENTQIYSETIDLRSLLNRCSIRYKMEAEKKGLRFVAKFASDLPVSIIGDSLRVKQALYKLLSNAVKYTKRGSVTFIVCVHGVGSGESKNMKIQFIVKDTGIGIDPRDKSLVFKEFIQADGGDARGFGGTGIGLAIVSRITQKMGGKIWFDSVLDEGSEFVLELPFRLADHENKGDVSVNISYTDNEKKAKVLVVDDDETNVSLVSMILEGEGYEAECATSGRDALEYFGTESFDLVLMDIQMPVMDGWQVTREMRQLEHERYGRIMTPIIALTAHVMRGYKDRCRNEGMNGYITKPIIREEFLEQVSDVLSVSQEK